jgi:hypothetical protein
MASEREEIARKLRSALSKRGVTEFVINGALVEALGEESPQPKIESGGWIMTELEKRGEGPNEESVEIPDGGGSVSYKRVQLYLERHPEMFNLAGEIDFHDGYVGKDWPRRGYALARKDIEDLLSDIEEHVSEIAELNEAYQTLSNEKLELLKSKDRADRLEKLVQSMVFNGARHHFVYAHQQWIEGRGWTNHCRECGKDQGHPAHFAQGAKYMDSREVEKQAREAKARVLSLLMGQGMGPETAQNVARDLLKVLPGIEDEEADR